MESANSYNALQAGFLQQKRQYALRQNLFKRVLPFYSTLALKLKIFSVPAQFPMHEPTSSSQPHSLPAEYTLGDALKLWQDSKEFQKVNVRFMKYLNIALKLYVLPELAPDKLNSEGFDALCDTLFIVELENGLDIYDRRFAEAVEQENTA